MLYSLKRGNGGVCYAIKISDGIEPDEEGLTLALGLRWSKGGMCSGPGQCASGGKCTSGARQGNGRFPTTRLLTARGWDREEDVEPEKPTTDGEPVHEACVFACLPSTVGERREKVC
jgi:hypothetical protein